MPTLPNAPTAVGQSKRAAHYRVNVLDSSIATPAMVQVFGLANVAVTDTFNLVDNTDYDSIDANGDLWTGQTIVSKGWSAVLTTTDKRYGDTTPSRDPGQKFLRKNSGKIVKIQWFDRDGDPDDAFEGYAWVQYAEGDGAVANTRSATITLTGDGKKTPIVNPNAAP